MHRIRRWVSFASRRFYELYKFQVVFAVPENVIILNIAFKVGCYFADYENEYESAQKGAFPELKVYLHVSDDYDEEYKEDFNDPHPHTHLQLGFYCT